MSRWFRERPIRCVTPKQLMQGYVERLDDGTIIHHQYEVVKKLDDGNYAVEATYPEKPVKRATE